MTTKITNPIMVPNSLNQKCMVKRLPQSRYEYEAILIQLVPRLNNEFSFTHCHGDDATINCSVDAIVVLQTFEKGAMLQLPLNQVKLVEEWPLKDEC